MKLLLVALTSQGKILGNTLHAELPNSSLVETGKEPVAKILADNWHDFDGFVCIMATGIVVRSIAPLLRDKYTDPCVLVLDPHGKHVISLLSGHLGGGNSLARKIAELTGGSAVITTGSDSLGLVPLDLWLAANNLVCWNRPGLTEASALLVNRGNLNIWFDHVFAPESSLPPGLIAVENPLQADLVISYRRMPEVAGLVCVPPCLVVGVGCNRNTPEQEFHQALSELFQEYGLYPEAILRLASIDKKADEAGLLEFAKSLDLEIRFFPKEQLNTYTQLGVSQAAMRAVGAIGVAEPAALLGGPCDSLLCRKRKWKNITMAVALAPFSLSAQVRDQKNI